KRPPLTYAPQTHIMPVGDFAATFHSQEYIMRKLRWLAFPAILCMAATLAHGGGDKKDKKGNLQGTWAAEKDGKKAEMTFTKDMFSIVFDGEKKFQGTFKTDASKTPKHIDMKITEGDKYQGMTALCIYEIDGDTLKWCANEPGKDTRPTAFADKEGGHLFLVFKRVK